MSSTNSRFVQDINRIVSVRSTVEKGFQVTETQLIPESRGIGESIEKKFQAGGIASPLKEIAGTREYYESELIRSSDGLFVMEQHRIKKAMFQDANGDQVIVEFAQK